MASQKKAGNKKLKAAKKLQHTKPLAYQGYLSPKGVKQGN